MARHLNVYWNLPDSPQTWEQVQVAVMMDVRDELKKLNGLLSCPNFTAIPHTLKDISKNTRKRRKRRVKK